jgi:hypothetical protein
MTILNLIINVNTDETDVYNDSANWNWDQGDNDDNCGNYQAAILKIGCGLKFNNVTIPSGATITTSYLTLTARGANNGTTCRSRITGNKQINPATWGTLADFQARRGTVVGGANNNNITTAQVTWDNIVAWADLTAYNSPEIKTIIQELINQGGWASGQSLAVFWDDFEGRSDAAACRFAYSRVTSTTLCAQLHIEYTTGDIPAIPLGFYRQKL